MVHKVFVSYKYADNNVKELPGYSWGQTTVRSYVDKFENRVYNNGVCVYKGEHDGEDLSGLSDYTIQEKLKERIYDSSVTIVFISPNMKDMFKRDKEQWIPWEISYSLRETTRNDRTSHNNAILAVILPDRNGSTAYYDYCWNTFSILKKNIDSGYIPTVKWDTFMGNIEYYIEKAINKRNTTPLYLISKSI